MSDAIPDTERSFVANSAALSRQRSRAASISTRNRTQSGNSRLTLRVFSLTVQLPAQLYFDNYQASYLLRFSINFI